MEQTPKLLLYNRRTVATLTAINKVLDKWTGYTIAGSGLSAMSTVLGGGKVDLWLPILSGLLGAVMLSTRELLAFLVASSVISNPINLEQKTTITQPEPITPSETPTPETK